MPLTKEADDLHAMKYRGRGEDFEESVNRLAFGLGDNSRHYHELRAILQPQRFCPAGRIQGAIGASRRTTAFNCYVSGTIHDSLGTEGSEDAIMDRLKESAITSKLGGGIGYDFSPLRPRGDGVLSIESTATGPVSFMPFFNQTGLGIASAGHRRGAQMAILRVDHPDVEEFVRCKQVPGALEGFNVSVAVTDEFMMAVHSDDLFRLRFGGRVYREVRALDLWNKIMRAAWDFAEPGVFFVDTVNRMNNLYYCETIAATNPCGEQPLPPFGACLLGSFNLVKYLKTRTGEDSTVPYDFDLDQLIADVPVVVRGMDNVIDRTIYPITAQALEARGKRRMGLGIMGLANAGEAMGLPYGSPPFLDFMELVLRTIRDESYRASALLAAEKGAFPLYDADLYPRGKFVEKLPADVLHLIMKHGIRNSHLTSIAPTGTISLAADNVSSGIEPVFSLETRRKVLTPTGPVEKVLKDYGHAYLSTSGKTSDQVTAHEHVQVLTRAQKWVDSAVSKTCNVDGSMPWDDFLGIYAEVHRRGGKGCTVFNRDGKRKALLSASPPTSDDGPTCEIGEDGRKSCE